MTRTIAAPPTLRLVSALALASFAWVTPAVAQTPVSGSRSALVQARLEGQAQQAQAAAVAAHPAAPADVSSMDAILKSLYDVISGPAGQKRDWDRFRSLFYEGARLIPATKPAEGPPRARVTDVEGYVTRASANMTQQGFYEREIAQRVEQFGSIAHVFSTYESKHAANDTKPFARGINSIQLYFDGTRYWIITILWDAERADSPLPPKYLETVK
jgi:hypothetical protein